MESIEIFESAGFVPTVNCVLFNGDLTPCNEGTLKALGFVSRRRVSFSCFLYSCHLSLSLSTESIIAACVISDGVK